MLPKCSGRLDHSDAGGLQSQCSDALPLLLLYSCQMYCIWICRTFSLAGRLLVGGWGNPNMYLNLLERVANYIKQTLQLAHSFLTKKQAAPVYALHIFFWNGDASLFSPPQFLFGGVEDIYISIGLHMATSSVEFQNGIE